MVILQDPEGLVFWPEWEIASWTPEYLKRWQAVRFNGEVAHRPTPPPENGPWVPLGNSLVLPQLLTREGDRWVDPALFSYPYEPLEPVPGPPVSPPMKVIPCTRDQVIMVTCLPSQDCQWVTEVGEFSTRPRSDEQIRKLHPDLLRLTGYRYFNKNRLRRTLRKAQKITFRFENGQDVVQWISDRQAPQFGLPNLWHLEPASPELYYGAGLRDWPFELATASEEVLSKCFQSPRRLISNVIWQAWRYRMAGKPAAYGKTHRDFWYEPLVIVLERAGMLRPKERRFLPGDDSAVWANRKKLYSLYQNILATFVRDYQFFTLSEFGFEDSRPEARQIGDRLPAVLVVAEKRSSRRFLERLHADFGVSTLLLSGQPSLLATENLAKALKKFGVIRILALADHDPHGWMIAEAVAEQLRHFGLEIAKESPEFILQPQLLSAEEIEISALPCPQNTAREKTLARDWVAKGGGIKGKPVGLLVNCLRPYQRVYDRVAEMLG